MIEYFYSVHSGFAYLGSARFMAIARAAERQIAHRPIDLDKVLAVTGPGATGGQTPARRAYFFGREIERWAEERGAPVVTGTPSNHYGDMTLANGILIAGLLQGQNIDRLAHRFLEAHWRDSADLTDPATLSALGTQAGLDPGPLLAAARGPEVQARYQANTKEAIARSVFGSPCYFVDGDMFYGQDRLEQVERALKTPFKGNWPTEV